MRSGNKRKKKKGGPNGDKERYKGWEKGSSNLSKKKRKRVKKKKTKKNKVF